MTIDPSSPDALKTWRHWKRTLDFFIESLPQNPPPNKLATLVNYVGPSIYELIADSTSYQDAIKILTDSYDKPKNTVFARHLLSCCKQEPGQSLDQFLQRLKTLAKECDFKAVSADVHREEAIRDAFISGLASPQIRQRLLEKVSLDLNTAFADARTLDMAEKQSSSYRSDVVSAAVRTIETQPATCDSNEVTAAAGFVEDKCYFCGYKKHPRVKCPAKEAICKKCSKVGQCLGL